jgi:hypothetical protein
MHARNVSHEALMRVLMLVFDQRMSAESVDSIDPQKRMKYL